jgi:hypothetical protein
LLFPSGTLSNCGLIDIDERYGKRFKNRKKLSLKREATGFTERTGHAIYGATIGQITKNSTAGKLDT